MAKGYWIVHITVTDRRSIRAISKLPNFPLRRLALSFSCAAALSWLQKNAARGRHVVIEFETYERAIACYKSADYQDAMKLRRAYAQSEIVIVEGIA